MNKKTDNGIPNTEVDVRKTFEIDADLKVKGFKAVSYTHLTLPTTDRV